MERAIIGGNYAKQPFWKVILGVPLIYLPILTTVPFVVVAVLLMKTHLKSVGGMNIKSYWDFVPDWASHRHHNSEQPAINIPFYSPAHYRFFWIMNCKVYCPLSVALFRYALYLVKIVENWWCPFAHDQKQLYTEGAIDESFWHVDPAELVKLHPDDRENPIWNERSGSKAGE
ncbi:MAG: hypothetical protein HGB11_14280 [Chlorobiales bacterium]|nr:hypothetical protein [Chlorobiales bacterium]